jgi:hypothetical protein
MNIVNDITYKHAEVNYEILYIIGHTKISKSDENMD